jgi:hypothetical protein
MQLIITEDHDVNTLKHKRIITIQLIITEDYDVNILKH